MIVPKGCLTSLAVLVLAAGLIGCAQDGATEAEPENGATTAGSGETSADPEIDRALAQLSPEDRALAEAQKVCPVTGEPLGSMGKPEKITVEGREVFICCAGCGDMVRENPEQYLSKLDQEKPE